jgi:hypothetical protein
VKQIHKRLTYANLMSTIAVFLVLGGGAAFAAGKLGKNSVGTKQLKNNAVTTAKIKNGAVTGAKVKLSSLGKVPSATSADSATSAGNANTVGGMTVSKISYLGGSDSPAQVILNTQGLILTASCPSGQPTVVATASVPAGVGVEFNSNETTTGGTSKNVVDDGTGTIFTTGDTIVTTRERGTFLFQRSDGHVVSGIFDGDDTPAIHNSVGGSMANCAFGATINAG